MFPVLGVKIVGSKGKWYVKKKEKRSGEKKKVESRRGKLSRASFMTSLSTLHLLIFFFFALKIFSTLYRQMPLNIQLSWMKRFYRAKKKRSNLKIKYRIARIEVAIEDCHSCEILTFLAGILSVKSILLSFYYF